MKELKITTQFKKDLKKYKNQHNKIAKLKEVLSILQCGGSLPSQYNAHRLLGNYKGCIECHIENDTLLIWIDEEQNVIKLLRLGTHSELFK